MRQLMAVVALAAQFGGPLPALSQDQQALERILRDAIDAPATIIDDERAEPELLRADEIDELVAPVALYPDSLLAQVLVASTFPLQIVQADRILEATADMTDDEVTQAIDDRDWDPSVLVLLTGFPDVIRRMAEDLDETERLGLAMAQQDQDVLQSVQRLREQAEATGWLADNEAQMVERVDDRIVIEPSNPEVVYVPRYDANRAFVTAPTESPVILQPGAAQQGFNPLLAGAIGFGSALLVNEMFGDDDQDNDKDGWDDYWRKDRRAIDWRDRQLYPRAGYWDEGRLRGDAAWSSERDRSWDRREKRWRAERAEKRSERRQARDWVVRRDRNTGKATVKLKDWSDVRAASERQDRRLDRSQKARKAERRREGVQDRDDRREAAQRDRAREKKRDKKQAAEARREKAGPKQKAEAAAARERAQKRAAVREKADDRDRLARREANQEAKLRKAVARARDENGNAARPKAQTAKARDSDAVRKARQVEKAKRQGKRVKAAAADNRPKQAAAKAPEQRAKPKAEAKRKQAQADKPKRKAQANDRRKKNKKRCVDGQGKNCPPNN